MIGDDRSKPPPGWVVSYNEYPAGSWPALDEFFHEGDGTHHRSAVDAAWAYVDQLKAQGAAEERERLARICDRDADELDGINSVMAGECRMRARWLRDGGKEEGQ